MESSGYNTNLAMFQNYFIVTLRQLIRQKGFTIINIAGLSIGMAIAIMIFLWVHHELSYDRFNSKSDRLYRLIQTQHYSSGPLTTVCMPGPIARDIRDEIPEIINSFTYYSLSLSVRHEERIFTEEVRLAGPQLFDMFDFEFLHGDPSTVFGNPNSAVLTDKMAEKLFDEEDPMGQVITLNNELEFKVSGIIRETPKNSSFRFDVCVPFEVIEDLGFTTDRYGWNAFYVYTELDEHADYREVNLKIRKYLQDKSMKQFAADGRTGYESDIDLFLFPLQKIHLHSYRSGERGAIQFIYIFSAIAVFILVIACINFMNMSTARASRRAKEISIRKSVGADRGHLVRQFLGESVLVAFLAMILALGLVALLLPYFNLLVEKELTLGLNRPGFWVLLVGVTVVIGLLAGSYPAFYLSGFNPVKTLRRGLGGRRGNYAFRRALVVFQFVLSVGLIIGTLVVRRQLDYLYNNKLGMDLNDVLTMRMRGNTPATYEVLKNELMRNPAVSKVTRASSIPFYIGSNTGGMDWEGKDSDDDIIVGFTFADAGYTSAFGMQMAAGRFFSGDIQSDTAAVVINETAARAFSMEDPVGKWLSWGENSRFKIIGVVQDFHHLPMQVGIDPLAIFYRPERCDQLFIRTAPGDPDQARAVIGETWEGQVRDFPFEPQYLRDIYENTYEDEARLIKIIGYFAILAILISCLGLFALSTYMAEQRTKEIGIRRVLGARTGGIVTMISREFVLWVLAANIIAWPLTWFALKNWLDSYAFHARLSPDLFASGLAISLVIALATVTFQSVSSALKKPVDAIKYE